MPARAGDPRHRPGAGRGARSSWPPARTRSAARTTPGRGTDAAAAFLDRLAAVAAVHPVVALPYGDVDVDALDAAGLSAVVDPQPARAPRTGRRRTRPPTATDRADATSRRPSRPATPRRGPGPRHRRAAPGSSPTPSTSSPRTDLAWAGRRRRCAPDTLATLQAGGIDRLVLEQRRPDRGRRRRSGCPARRATAHTTLTTPAGPLDALVADADARAASSARAEQTPGGARAGRAALPRRAGGAHPPGPAPARSRPCWSPPPRDVDAGPEGAGAMMADTAGLPWLRPSAGPTSCSPARRGGRRRWPHPRRRPARPGRPGRRRGRGRRARRPRRRRRRRRRHRAAGVRRRHRPGHLGRLARRTPRASGRAAQAVRGRRWTRLREPGHPAGAGRRHLQPGLQRRPAGADRAQRPAVRRPGAARRCAPAATAGLSIADIGLADAGPRPAHDAAGAHRGAPVRRVRGDRAADHPGRRPARRPDQLQVKSTAYGSISLIITIGAAALLGLLFLRRLVHFVLRRRRAAADAGAGRPGGHDRRAAADPEPGVRPDPRTTVRWSTTPSATRPPPTTRAGRRREAALPPHRMPPPPPPRPARPGRSRPDAATALPPPPYRAAPPPSAPFGDPGPLASLPPVPPVPPRPAAAGPGAGGAQPLGAGRRRHPGDDVAAAGPAGGGRRARGGRRGAARARPAPAGASCAPPGRWRSRRWSPGSPGCCARWCWPPRWASPWSATPTTPRTRCPTSSTSCCSAACSPRSSSRCWSTPRSGTATAASATPSGCSTIAIAGLAVVTGAGRARRAAAHLAVRHHRADPSRSRWPTGWPACC